ncbi:MAG TPA: hypothetical protein VGB84_05685 [Arachidicoccus sp.]
MKHSQTIGIIMALLLIVFCFLPWSYIISHDWTITGMNTMVTHYGKPGIVHIFFSVVSIALFAIQKLWSKRTNIFICALNLAWMVRNFLLMSACSAGDCPIKGVGIYLVIIASALMFIMSLLPKIEVNE